jgi:hypothetical protein
MTSFVVMEKAGEQELVRDGLSWQAFLAPPLWFAWTRLWVEAVVLLALIIGVSLLGDVAPGPATAASLAISFLAASEWSALKIAALRRSGWREAGVVVAADRAEAEFRLALRSGRPARPRPSLPITPAAMSSASPSLFNH